MSNDTGKIDYAAVLADLRASRDYYDAAITAIEAIVQRQRASNECAVALAVDNTETGSDTSNNDLPFLGLSVVDATKRLLAARRKPLGNPEIAAAIQAGGIVLNSVEPVNSVGSILTRRYHNVGDVVRVSRGTWGLKDWYPQTNFKTRQELPEDSADKGPEENGQ